jgi:hypothetical protein
MDSEFYSHVEERVLREFPGLVRIIGLDKAEEELSYGLEESYSHMLHPEELREIAELAVMTYLTEAHGED